MDLNVEDEGNNRGEENQDQLNDNGDDYLYPFFPSIILENIISFVTNKECFLNCMLTSHEIMENMYSSSKIMNNILYIFRYIDSNLETFLESRGRSIRCIEFKIIDRFEDGNWMRNILSKTANLKELKFDASRVHPYNENYEHLNYGLMEIVAPIRPRANLGDKIRLQHLTYLNIDTRVFNTFNQIVDLINNNLKSLKISVFSFEPEDIELAIAFICQQHNLKNLTIEKGSYSGYPLNPNRRLLLSLQDISQNAEFKLNTFEIKSEYITDNLENFIRSQVKNLKKITFGFMPREEYIEPFFYPENFGILNKMKLNLRCKDEFSPNDYLTWQLMELRLVNAYLNGPPPEFPYSVHLKCNTIANLRITCDKIVELDIQEIDVNILQDPKFPDLKRLKINKILKFDDRKLWDNFTKNIINVEKIKIIEVECNGNMAHILRNLNVFHQLKFFEFGYYPESNYNNKFIIDMELKEIKASTHIVRSYREYFDILIDKYANFEFTEVCVNVNNRPGIWEKFVLNTPEKLNEFDRNSIKHVYCQKIDINEFIVHL